MGALVPWRFWALASEYYSAKQLPAFPYRPIITQLDPPGPSQDLD
jgi:hypothetical protein